MADGPPAVAETCLGAASIKEPTRVAPPQLDRPCLCAPGCASRVLERANTAARAAHVAGS